MANFLIKVNTDNLPDHTEAQLIEWVEYSIGARAGIDTDNPLNLDDFTAEIIHIENDNKQPQPCEQHGIYPCRICKTKHYPECNCHFCKDI